MLELTISAKKGFDNKKNEFIETKETTLRLEHSLVSISKWEAKYHKPFISDEPKTAEETIDYIKFMTLTQNVDPLIYKLMDKEELTKINEYINDPMTATKFYDNEVATKGLPSRRKNEVITSELIYYWMIAFNIPESKEKIHLNRLLTLIRICNIKEREANGKGKMSKRDILSQNRALNAARRKKYNTHG